MASSNNGTTVQERGESDTNADHDDLRIFQTHLQSEAEQSYMAVRLYCASAHQFACCPSIPIANLSHRLSYYCTH